MAGNLVTTKELAKILDISSASVSYYTNLGLFKIEDKEGNTRLYNKDEIVKVFEAMHRLRNQGYSLKLINQKLSKGYSI